MLEFLQSEDVGSQFMVFITNHDRHFYFHPAVAFACQLCLLFFPVILGVSSSGQIPIYINDQIILFVV